MEGLKRKVTIITGGATMIGAHAVRASGYTAMGPERTEEAIPKLAE